MEISNTYGLVGDVYETILEGTKGETDRSAVRETLMTLWSVPSVYAEASNASTGVRIESLQLEDVTVADEQMLGVGAGQCTVVNSGDAPWQVRANLELLPLNEIGEERPRIGRGGSEKWVTIMPGKQALFNIEYQVLAPGLTGQLDVQALATLEAVPADGGWVQTAGPFSQVIRVGTEEHLETMPALDSEPLLGGELAIGEVHTTTLTLPSRTHETSFILSHSPAISLALTLEDEAGNHFEIGGMGLPAEFDGLSGTHSSGRGYQVVTLDKPPTGPMVLSVEGIISKRGGGLRYEVKRVSGLGRSVSQDLFGAAPESQETTVPEESAQLEEATQSPTDERGFQDVSIVADESPGLPWPLIALAALGILIVVAGAIAIRRRQ
jgi:hypothetical protein